MSSTILKIISTNASFEPAKEKLENARIFLERFFNNEQLQFKNTASVEFIDPGQNLETVSCNLCAFTIKVEDWQNAMNKAYEHQFANLIFTTPCCNKEASLNELNYGWPAGFAKFVICIADAQREVTKQEQAELQEILGTTLRIIKAHY